jgi:Undecaprenyl-phosphate glucose phosphotransferase
MTPFYPILYAANGARRRWPIVYDDFGFFVRLSDLAAILLASVIAGASYHLLAFGEIGPIEKFIVFGILFGALFLPCLAARGVYEPNCITDPRATRSTVVFLSAIISLFLAGTLFVLNPSHAFWPGHVFLFAAIAPGLVVAQRIALSQAISRALVQGRLNGRAIVLIREDGAGTARRKPDYERFGYRVVNSVVVPPRTECSYAEADWKACARQVIEYVREARLDEVHIALDWSRQEAVSALLAELQLTPVAVRLLPDPTILNLMRHPHVKVASNVAIELKRATLPWAEKAQKRTFDIFFSGAALVLCLPLFAVIALAISLDSRGPILFRQSRVGFNGRVFRIYKFRTMTVLEDGDTVIQATRDDPRITSVGRWLRRTSLDELPQLLNVIKGEMSLVGPRPHALVHDSEFNRLIANYSLRNHVMPGITGWAQVHGLRGETSTIDAIRQRVELDIQYIAIRTLLLDLQILAMTVGEVLRHRNAY